MRLTSAAHVEDATRLPPVPASPSPARSPATPLPFNPVAPFLDPVRWQHSRFQYDNDAEATPIPPPASRGFAVPAIGEVFAPHPNGVAYPSQVRDVHKTSFTWDQLNVDLQHCDFDIDTIIAPLYAKSFHLFSNFWVLAGNDHMGSLHNNFPDGMVITLHPWTVILQLDLPNIPDVSRSYADALHGAAKLLCQAIGEYPAGAKINIRSLPDTADVENFDKSSCLTRSQNQSVHADRLSYAFQKLRIILGEIQVVALPSNPRMPMPILVNPNPNGNRRPVLRWCRPPHDCSMHLGNNLMATDYSCSSCDRGICPFIKGLGFALADTAMHYMQFKISKPVVSFPFQQQIVICKFSDWA